MSIQDKPRSHTTEVIVINGYGLEKRTRTSRKSGKSSERYSITIKSEPIIHVFDDRVLGEGPALAIAAILKKQIAAISEPASDATNKFRTRAVADLAQGKPWAARRYTEMRGAGKGAPKRTFQPGTSRKLFNDSGLMAEKLDVKENRHSGESEWTIHVPGNRFDPRTWNGDPAKIKDMIERLQALVPELGNPEMLRRHREFNDALRAAINATITRSDRRGRNGALTDLGRAYAGLAKSLAGLGKGVLL